MSRYTVVVEALIDALETLLGDNDSSDYMSQREQHAKARRAIAKWEAVVNGDTEVCPVCGSEVKPEDAIAAG